jgi:cob(I)alamin adenosyltransferase
MKIYTRRGDDGTTGLRGGTRVPKNHPLIQLNGDIDEAQAALGVARAECEPGSELDQRLISIERDLWTVMGDIAIPCATGSNKSAPQRRVDARMVEALEAMIDEISVRFSPPEEFTVPGESKCAAALDLARTIVRRAERLASTLDVGEPILMYLNRLSDACWTLARYEEGTSLPARTFAKTGQEPSDEGKGRFGGAGGART